jgi:hypothetical protein
MGGAVTENLQATTAKQPIRSSRTTVRLRAVKRLVLWHGFSGVLPLYLVTEFPKSGGTWFSRMLAECLDVPFPDPWSNPRFQTCVMRGTHLYHRRFRNIVAVFRDGRDVMVSAYFFFLLPAEGSLAYGVERTRRRLNFKDYDDIRTNLPRFIEYMFLEFPRIGWSTRFNWSDFVDSWIDRDAPQVRYDELLTSPHATLARVVRQLTDREVAPARLDQIVAKYSFENMTGRRRGQEMRNAFARKGIAGDWKNHFTLEARQVFDSFGGKQLIDLGYETNRDWVNGAAEFASAEITTP